MEDVRKNESENKETWEAPVLTVLDVEVGTEGGSPGGADGLGYS